MVAKTPYFRERRGDSSTMDPIDPDQYFAITTPPTDLEKVSKVVQEFIAFQKESNRRVVLVTSGGTTVPLESNTVRFLDNFSAGTRGAVSSEYFIRNGYAVIFLHRQFSLEPYTRHYSHSKNCFLDMLTGNETLTVKPEYFKSLKKVWQEYEKAKNEKWLLKIDFVTVAEYLFKLRCITQQLSSLGSRGMFYLAAAVSDFFIPESKMVQHKIQSRDGGLSLHLDQVPKIIKPLVQDWASHGFIVSFKLETDPNLLFEKSRAALERYGHQIVIGNELHSRKYVVWFITPDKEIELRLLPEQIQQGVEIEQLIIGKLVEQHSQWIEQHQS